ncbi:MAG: indole-3-glycerol phosphate synthase TrpC [Bacteroidales bacterium]|nr:indole-3-glycerol phosphate synthase TrpC [Bacteroidales bacterium]
MTILEQIIADKRTEVIRRRETEPISTLEIMPHFNRKTLSLKQSLLNGNNSGIIAEFKKMSPSKGVINAHAQVKTITTGYSKAGATGLSVLTDSKYFGGSDEDLLQARVYNQIPILRKDFIVDEYQVLEAKGIGADVILLIAASLTINETRQLARKAHSLGLEVLLEIHSREETGHINEYIDIVGVNNRNLKDFTTNVDVSFNMVQHIPSEFVKISESGIHDPKVITLLKQAGYHGFLIGESFMKSKNPVEAFSQFVEKLNQQ